MSASPDHASIDATLLPERLRAQAIRESWMPVGRDGDTVVVAAAQPTRALAERVGAELGAPVRLVEAPRQRIVDAVLGAFAPQFEARASDALHDDDPERSARRTFTRTQVVVAVVALVVLAALFVLWPRPTLFGVIAVTSLVFLVSTVFKLWVSLRGARVDVVDRFSDAELATIDDAALPTYTVLVPVFREANIVARLVDNLGALDWPKDRLEILVLVEQEDDETRAALEARELPATVTIVTIPPGHPQTKPRACNVGLEIATGDYLVIYDAEDAPEPDQLKKAWLAFQRGDDDLVCVQAALNYFNAEENVLTRMFTLEYGYWFDYMLPGLDIERLPIPLGGTSNHFRTDALRELGGWDPYNVTEDADLGIRSSASGHRVGIIDSTTFEEANTSIPNFVRQRSRWIKGYMQTVLVHSRHPLRLIRTIGLRQFAGFALLIAGTPLVFLGVIPFGALTLLSLMLPNQVVELLLPWWALWPAMMNFLLGNVVMIYLNMMGPYRRGTFSLLLWAVLNPVYWLLHSVAAYKALWQLVTKPHYWEKTEHGLSEHAGPNAVGVVPAPA